MKTASFAAAVDRDQLRRGAAELGVDFDAHVAFVIAALQPHAAVLLARDADPAA
jgi:predicted hydrolase (HD superfamily)